MKKVASLLAAALVALVACSDEPAEEPAPVAPASRHGALRDSLVADARAFAFVDGDWQEDLGDAPFFGLGWLTHRKPREGDELARRDLAVSRGRTVLQGPKGRSSKAISRTR